jgi:hypothetical protein
MYVGVACKTVKAAGKDLRQTWRRTERVYACAEIQNVIGGASGARRKLVDISAVNDGHA